MQVLSKKLSPCHSLTKNLIFLGLDCFKKKYFYFWQFDFYSLHVGEWKKNKIKGDQNQAMDSKDTNLSIFIILASFINSGRKSWMGHHGNRGRDCFRGRWALFENRFSNDGKTKEGAAPRVATVTLVIANGTIKLVLETGASYTDIVTDLATGSDENSHYFPILWSSARQRQPGYSSKLWFYTRFHSHPYIYDLFAAFTNISELYC